MKCQAARGLCPVKGKVSAYRGPDVSGPAVICVVSKELGLAFVTTRSLRLVANFSAMWRLLARCTSARCCSSRMRGCGPLFAKPESQLLEGLTLQVSILPG